MPSTMMIFVKSIYKLLIPLLRIPSFQAKTRYIDLVRRNAMSKSLWCCVWISVHQVQAFVMKPFDGSNVDGTIGLGAWNRRVVTKRAVAVRNPDSKSQWSMCQFWPVQGNRHLKRHSVCQFSHSFLSQPFLSRLWEGCINHSIVLHQTRLVCLSEVAVVGYGGEILRFSVIVCVGHGMKLNSGFKEVW